MSKYYICLLYCMEKSKLGEEKIIKNKKGLTLIELILVSFMISLFFLVTFPMSRKLYDSYLLKLTAKEIRSTLYLAQQLSIDESRDYGVELFQDSYRIREQVFNGKILQRQKINNGIKVMPGNSPRITYNRHGNSSYGYFVLSNKQGEKIKIEAMIGTGKVRISNVYR